MAAEMMEPEKDPQKIALLLLKATALTDEQVFRELDAPRYTSVDYVRMACHILFNCQRCGTCCTTGDPIRLRQEDAALLAKHLKIPLNKALKKYTIPDPDRPGVLNFKHILPCKFYDPATSGCKIYTITSLVLPHLSVPRDLRVRGSGYGERVLPGVGGDDEDPYGGGRRGSKGSVGLCP